jgi:hypothetical protein
MNAGNAIVFIRDTSEGRSCNQSCNLKREVTRQVVCRWIYVNFDRARFHEKTRNHREISHQPSM